MAGQSSKYGLTDLLLLGDPRLYKECEEIMPEELVHLSSWVDALTQVMQAIRVRYQFGRGIAAPQLGIMKKLVYIDVDKPMIVINPVITARSEDMMELWDDCMSFPNLMVRVKRHRSIDITYRDPNWNLCKATFEDDMSELFQHEIDHLAGVLCTMRAIDERSFKWRQTPPSTT